VRLRLTGRISICKSAIMRIWFLGIASVLVGAAAGAVLGLWGTDLFSSAATMIGGAIDDPNFPALAPEGGPQPRLVIDSTHFDFGRMERKSSARHTFVFRNLGHYPLSLRKGSTTCKCTLSNLTDAEVQPGQSTDVTLEWTAKTGEPHFSQSATILTNDPKRRSVTLSVEGFVYESVSVDPPEIVFSNLTSDEEATAKTRVFTVLRDDLEITGHTFENAETAQFFQVHSRPLPSDALPPDSKGGCEVSVTVKPGLPAGNIDQRIRLQLNLPDIPDAEVKIAGRIGSPILVVGLGSDLDQDRGVLRLGTVNRAQGTSRHLKLMIRGPHRKEVRLHVAEVKPDFVKVTLAAPEDLANVVSVPLSIEIPPGSPVVNHLGNATGAMGEVRIETDPAELGELRLRLAFAVTD